MDDDAALAWAACELLDLVRIASFSGAEHDAVDHLAARCASSDLPVRRLPVQGAADDLVIGWSSDPDLLLTAHVDTVTPEWSWTASRDGDVVRALGSADCKGSVVAFALGMLLAREEGVDLTSMPVALGICVDEELLGRGSIVLAGSITPRFVLAGEPSRLDVGIAEAGFVDVRCRVRGRAAHGSFPELGDNAIEKAARLILALHDEPFARITHPTLGRNVPGALTFEGGSDLHVIPDVATTRIEIRVVPGGPTAAQIESRLRALAAEHDADVELVEESVEPFETDPASPLLGALEEASVAVLGTAPARIGVPAWTDAHNFVDLAGSQAVVWGPGDFAVAHAEDESVDLRDVVRAARVVQRLLGDAGSWLA